MFEILLDLRIFMTHGANVIARGRIAAIHHPTRSRKFSLCFLTCTYFTRGIKSIQIQIHSEFVILIENISATE